LRAEELQTEKTNNIVERIRRLEKLASNYLSIGDKTVTIILLTRKERIEGKARAQQISTNAQELKTQLGHERTDLVRLWRENKVKAKTDGSIIFPCGCSYREIPAGLKRVSTFECPLQMCRQVELILKSSGRRKTRKGKVEPEFVQAIHDLLVAGNVDSIEYLVKKTGLSHTEVMTGLEWLVSENEVFIPKGFWKAQHEQATKKQKKKDNNMKKKHKPFFTKVDAFSRILTVFQTRGFTCEYGDDYVFAVLETRGASSLGFFVSIQDSKSNFVQRYSSPQVSTAFHVSQFGQRLGNMLQWFLHPRQGEIGELGQDVLTSFGWHAYFNEDLRQMALLAAENELGEEHVTRVLGWLTNAWKNHPLEKFGEYSEIASADFDWFRSNVSSSATYFRLKKELDAQLETQYDRLFSEGRIRHDAEIMRFYLVSF
jgi:hypothetical protein